MDRWDGVGCLRCSREWDENGDQCFRKGLDTSGKCWMKGVESANLSVTAGLVGVRLELRPI